MSFAIVTRDELWEAGALREERLSYGTAEDNDGVIVATDTPDEELLSECGGSPPLLPKAVASHRTPTRVRVVTTARRCGQQVITETTIVVTAGDLSIITDPEHAGADVALLLKLAPPEAQTTIDYRGLPMVWRNGSGSVLLHEAVGHAAEHRQEPLSWPEWLSVRDEPPFAVDDVGRPTQPADLLRGQPPASLRRTSFTDVPLPRLSNVMVRQEGAPFDLPEPRLEVLLVTGGRYDPLSGGVLIAVAAADLVEAGGSQRVAPFVISESRVAVARAIRGASGEPERYPGVICSSEGQEIAVGSHAPLLLTIF
ncbi:MAG TPA: hypothetical protein VFT12_07300 [Thermoanaerobaculia bacterium]|nr:hypothetical protein [Thermoanaerobaculia bacterium]